MTNVDHFIEEFLPPQTYTYRKDGAPLHLIDRLSTQDKAVFAEKLIERLQNGDTDLWIVEGLAYLKSVQSLPALYKQLDNTKEPSARIVIASSIFEISHDTGMCNLILEDVKHIKDKYALISLFYAMAKVRDEKIYGFIRTHFNHPDYLVSYNAKRAVGYT